MTLTFNRFALRTAKTQWSFGCSECNTVKVIGGQTLLKNTLSAFCLLKGLMDFKQTCVDISLGEEKEVLRF